MQTTREKLNRFAVLVICASIVWMAFTFMRMFT